MNSKDCFEDSVVSEFDTVKNVHNGKGDVRGVHVIQSWNEDESRRFSPEKFNALGRRMAEEYFTGHGYLIVTHTDTGKVHNHIIVNPWHTETGRKIENKKYHLYKLRDINDQISRECGLKVIQRNAIDRPLNLPDKAIKISKFGGFSYLLDTVTKADIARAYSRSYNEYVSVMRELGIGVRVDNKNITYFYPGTSRGKRGDKLGKKYDKAGLEKSFQENDDKFKRFPLARSYLSEGIDSLKLDPSKSPAITSMLSQKQNIGFESFTKDFSSYTKTPRNKAKTAFVHETEFKDELGLAQELRTARRSNIIDYCKINGIKLTTTKNGDTVLAGREYVSIGNTEWINHKNKTRGSLIEFVAAYKDKTLLQAVSEINKNGRLLELEKIIGEVKCKYHSFYIPKHEKSPLEETRKVLSTFLKGKGIDHAWTDQLLKRNEAEVYGTSLIRLTAEPNEDAALEIWRDNNSNQWKTKVLGNNTKPFISVKSFNSKKLNVFLDPFVFMKERPCNVLSNHITSKNILCLFGPNKNAIDLFVFRDRNIKEVNIVKPRDHEFSKTELDLFSDLKKTYQPLGISLEMSPLSSNSHCQELEIPFH